MKKQALLFFALSVAAFGQGVRYDIPPILNSRAVLVPNANISLCPGTATITNSTCSPASTQAFTDITLTTPCATGSPVVLPQTSVCSGVADALGNAGFWLKPGAYIYCITGPTITGKCYNLTLGTTISVTNCSSTGLNTAIASLPNGGIIDTTSCSGTPQITSTVSIPQGIDVKIGPGATWQASACPAFKFTGEGATLEGTSQGNPLAPYTTGGLSNAVVQAITGCASDVIDFDIPAGSKGGTLRNIRIDANSISTVTSCIANGRSGSQVERNVVRDVSCGGMPAGATKACLFIGSNSQSFLVDNLSAQLCPIGIDASATLTKNTIINNSRITCTLSAVPCVIVGSDDNLGANVSQDFQVRNTDIETSSATPTMLVKLQNIRNFQWIGGWAESDPPSSYTTMVVMGDASSTPQNPTIIGLSMYGDGNVSYNIELNSVNVPTLMGNLFLGANVKNVKNTSGVSGAVILGNDAAGTAGLLIDSTAGVTALTGNTSLAADKFIAGLGLVSNTLVAQAGNSTQIDAPDGAHFVQLGRNASGGTIFDKGDGTNTPVADINSAGLFWGSGLVLLDSVTIPTIAAAGCGGAAASIVTANGTAAFKVNVGTTPGSACTLTFPAATMGWNVTCNDITTQSTSVFVQKQTGAESTTSVTITNFNDVAAATAFTASDILKCTAFAD